MKEFNPMNNRFEINKRLDSEAVLKDQKYAPQQLKFNKREKKKNARAAMNEAARQHDRDITAEMRGLYGPPTTKPANCRQWSQEDLNIRKRTTSYKEDTYKQVERVRFNDRLSFNETVNRLLLIALDIYDKDPSVIMSGFDNNDSDSDQDK